MIKTIMVHLDGTVEDEIRIQQAEAVAARCDARITGLFTNPLPEYAYVMGAQSGYGDIGPVIELEQQIRRAGDTIVEKLEARLRQLGGEPEVRRIDAWPSAIPNLAVSQARCADLFIATTPYRDPENRVADAMTEAVLFEAGHGVLLIPPQCPVRRNLSDIVIAWTDTTASIRAVTEALPLLAQATRVRLLAVNTQGCAGHAERAADIASHLSRHGVHVEILAMPGENSEVGFIIGTEAAKLAADVIVMGGYGHSRFREWILGGATRDVIQATTVPLLLAH